MIIELLRITLYGVCTWDWVLGQLVGDSIHQELGLVKGLGRGFTIYLQVGYRAWDGASDWGV
jgi:hypothetical protein